MFFSLQMFVLIGIYYHQFLFRNNGEKYKHQGSQNSQFILLNFFMSGRGSECPIILKNGLARLATWIISQVCATSIKKVILKHVQEFIREYTCINANAKTQLLQYSRLRAHCCNTPRRPVHQSRFVGMTRAGHSTCQSGKGSTTFFGGYYQVSINRKKNKFSYLSLHDEIRILFIE